MSAPHSSLAPARIWCLLALGLLAPLSPFCALHQASAQGKAASKGDVVAELKAYRVISKPTGAEELTSADKIKPGEIIEYQVEYRNASAQTVRNVNATLPIPAALEFMPTTAHPTEVTASVDGKLFAHLPLKRAVRSADGQSRITLVPVSQYRFLRWTFAELKSGQTIVVKARARLAGNEGK